MDFVPKETRDWLPELVVAIGAIANSLEGHEPTLERLSAAAPTFVDAIPDHRVEIWWLERGYLNDPDIDEAGEPEWAITISGFRLKAGWLIAAKDLPRVLGRALEDQRGRSDRI
jgi:hypothetical protein